jgi:hypothetical protein
MVCAGELELRHRPRDLPADLAGTTSECEDIFRGEPSIKKPDRQKTPLDQKLALRSAPVLQRIHQCTCHHVGTPALMVTFHVAAAQKLVRIWSEQVVHQPCRDEARGIKGKAWVPGQGQGKAGSVLERAVG